MEQKGAPATSATEQHDVVVVGGGPVGLVLGLSLAERGLDVLVMEAEKDIVPSPRALLYFTVILNEFRRLGILDDVVDAGFKNEHGLFFRTRSGEGGTDQKLALMPSAPGYGFDYYGIQLGQHRLAGIIRKHAQRRANFKLRYATRFVSLEQHNNGVTIQVDDTSSEGKRRVEISARFVVGCDGGTSPVRKFLSIPFEGYTWERWRFLAINIKCAALAAAGYGAANHVVDPEDWAVVARASDAKEGLWRIATGIDAKIPVDEIEKHIPAKLERLLPGGKQAKYELIGCNPYWAHERIAKDFRVGRVLLCGDAAHLVNPLTALGLTAGLLDAGTLSRLLPEAFTPSGQKEWPALLDRYCDLRRADFVNRIQKIAVDGYWRIHGTSEKVAAERDDFFNMLNNNPGFGKMVTEGLRKPLPEDMRAPSPARRVAESFVSVLGTIKLLLLVVVWKMRAAMGTRVVTFRRE